MKTNASVMVNLFHAKLSTIWWQAYEKRKYATWCGIVNRLLQIKIFILLECCSQDMLWWYTENVDVRENAVKKKRNENMLQEAVEDEERKSVKNYGKK